MQLPSPFDVRNELPLKNKGQIDSFRNVAIKILEQKDPRLALFIGPCSIHDPKAIYEYAEKLLEFFAKTPSPFFPILRVFIEKPRTSLGWKGFLHDPNLDASYDLIKGIYASRELLLALNDMGIAVAVEILEPLAVKYFEDLITWGFIGARTVSSPIHRQLASNLLFPIGMKNNLEGNIDSCVFASLVAHQKQHFIDIDEKGNLIQRQSMGNPYAHVVLRGSIHGPNFDLPTIQAAQKALTENNLPTRLIIDCSHGNCTKTRENQKQIFEEIFEKALQMQEIRGLMLEGNLFSGNQPLDKPQNLRYGVSVTDPCLGLEETMELLTQLTLSHQ